MTLSIRFILNKRPNLNKFNVVAIYRCKRNFSTNWNQFDNNNEKVFKKILVANRGEIACRIMKTAKKMGIKTVAVYSNADTKAKHVKLADEAIFLGASEAVESYLNMGKILAAVRSSGADAVHPGYGFLSENASFVKALEEENVRFIGPSAEVIARMGDKLESKRAAMGAGVSAVPGFDGIITDAEHCVQIARQIGYPVMIKASAGGGGKGMRIARSDEQAREGFRAGAEEAAASFGDGRMLLEKFIDSPRHIEIQMLADKHGNAVFLHERECSIQRRNQKVVEEAPSTLLSQATRQTMGEQAISLCKKLNYHSAGTVEFLVDAKGDFYFLEMNTRLQVEHPVTELITGIDLVQEMIRIAEGRALPFAQKEVRMDGWAVECRVYAEDPFKDVLGVPSTGRLHKYCEPQQGGGVRCDSGVDEGSEISVFYDPLMCKLACHGQTREEAIRKSVWALDRLVIRGVEHNIPLLREVLTARRFTEGDINTNYLLETYRGGFRAHQLCSKNMVRLLAAASALYAANELKNRTFLNAPRMFNNVYSIRDQWNIVITFEDGDIYPIVINLKDDEFFIKINKYDMEFSIKRKQINFAQAIMEINVNECEQIVLQLIRKNSNGEYKILFDGIPYNLNILSERAAKLLYLMPPKSKVDISKLIKAPMPGIVKSVACKIGDHIAEGQQLCSIEAMKMQNTMLANSSGIIKKVYIQKGDIITDSDVLIEFL